MADYTKPHSPPSPNDDEFLRRKNEELLRRRAELGIKNKAPISTRVLENEDSEDSEDFKDFEEREELEEFKESPGGDFFPPSVAPKTKIQNTEDKPPTTSLPTASVEMEFATRGGAETDAERLFRAGRYNDIDAGDFIQLAWAASAGNSWQVT